MSGAVSSTEAAVLKHSLASSERDPWRMIIFPRSFQALNWKGSVAITSLNVVDAVLSTMQAALLCHYARYLKVFSAMSTFSSHAYSLPN